MPLPSPPPLRVIAVPGHLVADDAAYQANNRFRFVGRSPTRAKDLPANPSLEQMYPPAEREYADDHEHRYVLRALQKGALRALDPHTEKRAGIKKDEPEPAQKSAAKTKKGGDA